MATSPVELGRDSTANGKTRERYLRTTSDIIASDPKLARRAFDEMRGRHLTDLNDPAVERIVSEACARKALMAFT